MIILRKHIVGPRVSRQMLLPAILFLLLAVTSVAAGEAVRILRGDATAAVGADLAVHDSTGSGV